MCNYNCRAFLMLAAVIFPVDLPTPVRSSGSDVRFLRVDEFSRAELHPGEVAEYGISLARGDYMQALVDQIDGGIDVEVYDPMGRKIKTVSDYFIDEQTGKPVIVESSELEEVNLIGLRQGTYRLVLRAANKAKSMKFTITYADHKTLAERMELPPLHHAYQSPEIAALTRELQEGHRGALDAFWDRVKTQGEPLIEEISGDPKNMLVTVLWRDTYGVNNVVLERFRDVSLAQRMFTRLLDTDLWYLTFKLPSGARFVYQLSPDDDLIPFDRLDPSDNNARQRHEAGLVPDPLNPHHWIQNNADFSLLELPGAPPQPWIVKQKNVPEGVVEKQHFKSDLLNNDREIAIYTPPGYSSAHPAYWLMVLFDEKPYLTMVPTPTIMDNLMAAKKIPEMVVVLVDAIDRDRRRRETMGPQATQYVNAIANELIPWIREHYNVKADPAHTIIGGSSANGFASVHAAWLYPSLFGNVLCQSGDLSWEPRTGQSQEGHPEWLARQLADNPRKPIRFFMEAGLLEDDKEGILYTSRHFSDVARAKGYQIKYQEFSGGHNYVNWRGSLADGLIYLTSSSVDSLQK